MASMLSNATLVWPIQLGYLNTRVDASKWKGLLCGGVGGVCIHAASNHHMWVCVGADSSRTHVFCSRSNRSLRPPFASGSTIFFPGRYLPGEGGGA